MRRCRTIPVILVILASAIPGSAADESEKSDVQARPFEAEIGFIEKLRGVTFPGEVRSREIRRADLREFLREAFARDLSLSEQDYFDVLRALHLIGNEPEDPLEVLLDLYVEQVLAFYDPVEDLMYSIDEAPQGALPMMTAAFERAVTIHELVHALQDQRFGAGETLAERSDHWDRSLAYHALIEGEATLVMLAVLIEDLGGSLDEALADDQILAALGEAAAMDFADEGTPAYFVESLKFPYVEGLAYAVSLYLEGGWDAIDRAHSVPPGSTEQIYDGEAPGPPPTVAAPDSLFETTLGEFHWRYLLGTETADGWDSDRVALVREEDGLDVIAVTRWSSDEAAASFASHYERFLKSEGREPVVHIEGESVTVVYGPDRERAGRLMERQMKGDTPPEMEESATDD